MIKRFCVRVLVRRMHRAVTAIFVNGGPGTGKGTQCARLVAEFNIYHINVGALLRQQVMLHRKDPKASIKHGALIERILSEGSIVPSHISVDLLVAEMQRLRRDRSVAAIPTANVLQFIHHEPVFLIDGFPRNLDNLRVYEQRIGLVRFMLWFHCPSQVLIPRLLQRAQLEGREDDTSEVIAKRLDKYERETTPVLNVFRAHTDSTTASRMAFEINANASVGSIYSDHVRPSFLRAMTTVFRERCANAV